VLLELTVAEQRFNAFMEVLRDGVTVIEVAERYSRYAAIAVAQPVRPPAERHTNRAGRRRPVD
jgi:hypothetical protein